MLKLQRKNIPFYLEIMRVNKPIGTYLVIWPALWALLFASSKLPPIDLVIIFTLGAFLMRSAGCVINDYADRKWDGLISRTSDRPLAKQKISAQEALQLFVFLVLCSACLLIFLDNKTKLWSLGAIALASIYPFTKRVTHWPQVVLGMAFAWSIPMAFVASTGSVNATTWILFLATTIWVVIYDTFYAMVDREDDIKVGIKSTAVLFGSFDRLVTGLLQLMFLALMIKAGIDASYSAPFYAGVFCAALLFIYQQYLIRYKRPEDCFKAFLNNNYVGMVLFAGILVNSLVN